MYNKFIFLVTFVCLLAFIPINAFVADNHHYGEAETFIQFRWTRLFESEEYFNDYEVGYARPAHINLNPTYPFSISITVISAFYRNEDGVLVESDPSHFQMVDNEFLAKLAPSFCTYLNGWFSSLQFDDIVLVRHGEEINDSALMGAAVFCRFCGNEALFVGNVERVLESPKQPVVNGHRVHYSGTLYFERILMPKSY